MLKAEWEKGYNAAWEGQPLDIAETLSWAEGWQDGRNDEGNGATL